MREKLSYYRIILLILRFINRISAKWLSNSKKLLQTFRLLLEMFGRNFPRIDNVSNKAQKRKKSKNEFVMLKIYRL